MKMVKMMLILFVAAGCVASVQGADNKKLLVGKWEAAKVEENSPLPKGTLMDMKADGTMTITIKAEKEIVIEATYTVDGDSFNVLMKSDDKKMPHKISIKKLTEEELEAVNEKKQVILFKRVK
jgi:uncharacterized protein (TIGR03066 family)